MSKRMIAGICLAALLSLCAGCGKEENNHHISMYTISYLEEEENAEYLAMMLENKTDEKIPLSEGRVHTEEHLIYVGGENLASQTGTDISSLTDNGYMLIPNETSLYIYALSERGFHRAYDEMLNWVDEDGNCSFTTERVVNIGNAYPQTVKIGESEISEYSIVLPKKTSDVKELAAAKLQSYICQVSGAYLPIVKESKHKAGDKAIFLTDCTNEELYNTELPYQVDIKEGQITISISSEEAYEDCIDVFANTYLGFAFAGTDREHISTVSDILRITQDNTFMEEGSTIWMEEREAIICLWKTNTSRGAYYNGNTSLASEIMSYSDDQLYEYIKMLKYCGFTGIQVTDMCSNWAAFGGYEFVHDRLRMMADIAHSLDMKFTLWVWGAEFTGYGWVDESVTYSSEGYNCAYENPQVVETFEKYYSIYAELADCSDRIIAHYSDPGQLTNQNDIAYFAAMLREKFRSVNPDISFGVNCWRNDIDMSILKTYLGTDFIAYEGGQFDDPDGRSSFRATCNYLEVPFGTWSWNGCEMEIDQLAQMNVNAKLLQNRYQGAVATDAVRGESLYWSEMDSYHLVNVFSLYCAGHLLQNPYADTDELLKSIAYDMVGDNYGEALYEILTLIEDARTGDSYDTFFWSRENYVLKSDDYAAEDILERADRLLPILEEMIEADLETNVIPMPVDVTTLLQLVEPHVAQIQQFAQFRRELSILENLYAKGESKSVLQSKADEIYEPIPEYNCIIGMWGQPEARAQYELLDAFCKKAGITTPQDDTFRYYRKQRIYQEMCSFQKGREDIYYDKKGYYQGAMAFGVEATIDLENELIEEGLLSETKDGLIYVTDWKNYRYHFQ